MSVGSSDDGDPSGTKPIGLPKVLFGEAVAQTSASPAHIRKDEPSPKPLFGEGKPPTKGSLPKVLLGGELRIRLDCSVVILRTFDPTATEKTAKQALSIVNGTNIETQTFNDVLRFGERLQAKHGQVTETSMQVASAPVFVTGQTLRQELSALFRKLPPDMAQKRKGKSLRQRLRSFLEVPATVEEVLKVEYPKLRAKSTELSALESSWQEILAQVAILTADIETTLDAADAFVLAATFLINHLREQLKDERDAKKIRQYQTQEEALSDRVYSLRMTRLTIAGGMAALERLSANAKQYLHLGQTMSAVNLPAWHTAFVSSLVAAQNNDPVRTDRFQTLRDIHAAILNQLNN